MKDFEINWDNCTNKDEILSQYTEEEFKEMIPYGLQPEYGKFRYIKFGDKHYASIDEPIADLIIYLNENCYPTTHCCCGHRRKNNSKSSYYISFEGGGWRKVLIHKIIESVLEDPLAPEIENIIERSKKFCSINRRDIKKLKLKTEAKEHISEFHPSWHGVYFKWRSEEDIKWINDLIISCM